MRGSRLGEKQETEPAQADKDVVRLHNVDVAGKMTLEVAPNDSPSHDEEANQRRLQDKKDVVIFEGLWGEWRNWVEVPEADYRFACGARVRFESHQGRGDDTAANGVRFVFCGAGDWQDQETLSIYDGRWGGWGQQKMCPEGYYIDGAKVRFEDSLGRGGDDTALNGLAIRCHKPYTHDRVWVTVESGLWGAWKSEQFVKDKYLVGAQIRFENPLGGGDDTAWNGLKMRFASFPCVQNSRSNCYSAHLGKGCDDDYCEKQNCAQDPYCCVAKYDGICMSWAEANCRRCT